MVEDPAENQEVDRESAAGPEVRCSRGEQGARATLLTYELRKDLPGGVPTESFINGIAVELEVTVACNADGDHSFAVTVLRAEADTAVVDQVDGCIRLALKSKLGNEAEFEDQDPRVVTDD